MRCGQDSDCNPASAGGVLATILGRRKLPEKFTSALDSQTLFKYTAYSFATLQEASEKLARQAILRSGGLIEKNDKGVESFLIPVQTVKPSKFVQSWKAEASTGSRYTDEERAKITAK